MVMRIRGRCLDGGGMMRQRSQKAVIAQSSGGARLANWIRTLPAMALACVTSFFLRDSNQSMTPSPKPITASTPKATTAHMEFRMEAPPLGHERKHGQLEEKIDAAENGQSKKGGRRSRAPTRGPHA